MIKILLLATAATLTLNGPAFAQDGGPKPMLNCHPPSNGALAWDSQAVEKSAILPSAGGDTTSAAPTAQRHGLSVEVRSDCPPESKSPDKAAKPNG